MDLRSYLGAIRKNWWIVLLVLLVGGLAGYGQSKRSTPVYAGHITFYVATPGLSGTSPLGSDQFAQDRANTYAQLLSSERLATMIISAEGLAIRPAELAGEMSGAAELNTVLVKATIKDPSLQRLRTITDAVAREFPTMVDDLDNSGATSSAVRLSVVSGPAVGSSPVSPRTTLNVALGAAIGLLLGLLLAALREVLDVSIRTSEALQEFGGAPVIGAINFDSAAKKAPLIVGDQVHSVRAEAFRQLRTNVRFLDAADPVEVIAVTSSVTGEGKSTTASNLALVFAETGVKVVLVDADLRRSKVADYLGIEPLIGLTDVLVGRCDLDDALQAWGSDNIVALPSGSTPPNPSGLLGSPAMHELVAELRRRFDIVILDTPPVVPVTDATVVATYVDGVMVVFRHGKTRRAHLATSLRLLRGVNARVLGFVLNMKPLKGREASGYGRYGYRGDRAAEPAARRRLGRRRHAGVAEEWAGGTSSGRAYRDRPVDGRRDEIGDANGGAGRQRDVAVDASTGKGVDLTTVTDSLRDE
jgi:succinoglycan biosynthesis transport protein ExoP